MTNPLHKLDRELRKWSEVRHMLAGEDLDEQTLLDAMEGETDLQECVADIDAALLEDETQLVGLNAVIQRLEARALRHDKAIKNKRRLLQKVFEQAGITKLKLPTATISLGRTPPKVVIFEESAIPEDYWVQQDPKLDKAAVKKALQSGTNVVGATLDNGSATITIRRS